MSKQAGIDIPFLRPDHFAKDESTANEVILHTLDMFSNNYKNFDYFIYLQPTSPFRTVYHIDKSLESFISNKESDSLVSIKKVSDSPFWMKVKSSDGYLKEFMKGSKIYENRQQLPEVYVVNGAIYISNRKFFINKQSFYRGNCVPYLMDNISSLDIDTIEDWNYAEYLLR